MSVVPKDVTDSLDKLTKYLDSSGKDVHTVIDGMQKQLESESRKTNVNAVCSAITKIGNSIDAFKSGDTIEILSSVLDITSSISVIIPQGGPFISAACSLFSAVLGAVGSRGKKTMGSVLKEVIEEALNNYEDSELRAEVEGTLRVYKDSLAYLDFDAGTILTEGEVENLPIYVPIYRGINMLGILKSKVNDTAIKTNLTQGKRAIVYTNLYVKLATLRSLIFLQMQTIIKSSGHSHHTLKGIKRVAQAEEEHDKEFIKFLTTPTYDKAYLFVQLMPSKEPLLSKFLNKHGLQFQKLKQLTTGVKTFRPKKWSDWYIKVGYFALLSRIPTLVEDETKRHTQGSKSPGNKGKFYIETINIEDSLFYIRSKQWPNWYVCMQSPSVMCVEGRQGPSCHWKLLRFEDDMYMFSSVEKPDLFAYMNWHGSIKAWEGDPGPQGHWLLD